MKNRKISEKKKTIGALFACALLFALLAFLCFYKLGVKYVDPWDEARHGVNAYEMLKSGKLFQNTYLYEPDYYNLKPPFSMWCQMVSFLILGVSPFSLRFYSGLCYLITAAVCARFLWKRYGRVEAVLGLGLLACNTTPFAAHMVRAGDADSLYVLLFTLAMLFMIQIPEKQSNLYLCGLFFALAFLTKSYHAGVIAVIGGLYLIASGEIKKMKAKTWLYFAASCILPLLVWAVPRFMADGTAFFKAMILTDVLGRTDGTLQNNIQPFGWYAQYYLGTMSGKLMIYLWALMVDVAGLFLLSIGKTKEERKAQSREVIAYALWILIPFLAFSAVSNKLLWYLYPVTIPLLLVMAVVSGKVIKEEQLTIPLRALAAILAAVCITVYGKDVYTTIHKQTEVEGNDFQNLVRLTSSGLREQYGSETTLYAAVIYGPDENGSRSTDWAGQDVFVAESSGDLKCLSGGDAALSQTADDNGAIGILFLSRQYEQEWITTPAAGDYIRYEESAENVAYIKK